MAVTDMTKVRKPGWRTGQSNTRLLWHVIGVFVSRCQDGMAQEVEWLSSNWKVTCFISGSSRD